jgi:nitrous oxidase accessory protein
MKRKCLVVGIILLFIGTAIIPSTAQNIGKSSSSSSRGNTLYVGGSGPGNYSKIQDAINNASDGDTVFVYSGLYQENEIKVYHSISIIGEDKNTTIIDRSRYGFDLYKNLTNFTGFTIQNALSGIYIPSSYDKIFNNIFTNLSDGITVCQKCRIENNTFINVNSAIFLTEFGGHNVIQYNIIKNNQVGIHNDEYNIYNSYNVIQNNVITNNVQGIAITNSESNVIYGNTIRNNTEGIYIGVSSWDNITSNNITLNKNGIKLSGVNADRIYKNNIYLNTRNAVFYTIPIVPNIFFRNYWGPRLLPIKIIFGLAFVIPITPYLILGIPWINIDLFPSSRPYKI